MVVLLVMEHVLVELAARAVLVVIVELGVSGAVKILPEILQQVLAAVGAVAARGAPITAAWGMGGVMPPALVVV
jgi:hypothetical protein